MLDYKSGDNRLPSTQVTKTKMWVRGEDRVLRYATFLPLASSIGVKGFEPFQINRPIVQV